MPDVAPAPAPQVGGSVVQNLIQAAILRWVRSAISTFIAAWIAHNQKNPLYIAIQPFLAMLGKYLRDKYNWNWLPF